MAFFRRPLVRRLLAAVLVVYLAWGPVFALSGAAHRSGWAGVALALPVGAVTLACCLWMLAGERRGAWLLLASLVGGLVLHVIEPFTGLGFAYVVVFAAPYRAGPRSAAAVTLLDVIATFCVSYFVVGTPLDASLGITLGLTYSAVFAFLLWHLSVTRARSAEVAEARAREAVLAERTRLAREIHDILAHSQSAQIVHLEGARLLLEGGDAATALQRINLAVRLARAGLEETRRALDTLRGEELPLAERLERLAVEFRSATGAPCALSVRGDLDSLAAGARLAVARTAQEALTNVRKHAPGASASVALRRTAGWCELEVRDTGGPSGPPVSPGGGYGLVGMRERAELIGGSLRTEAGAAGFSVLLRVPA